MIRVDPTATTNPESFEELRSWMGIDTALHHRPAWLVANPMVRATIFRGRLPDAGAWAGFRSGSGLRRRRSVEGGPQPLPPRLHKPRDHRAHPVVQPDRPLGASPVDGSDAHEHLQRHPRLPRRAVRNSPVVAPIVSHRRSLSPSRSTQRSRAAPAPVPAAGRRPRTTSLQEPSVIRVDPTATTNPESFEEFRSWMGIDTALHHRPAWLVVNPMVRASIIRVRLPASGCRGLDRVPLRVRAVAPSLRSRRSAAATAETPSTARSSRSRPTQRSRPAPVPPGSRPGRCLRTDHRLDHQTPLVYSSALRAEGDRSLDHARYTGIHDAR